MNWAGDISSSSSNLSESFFQAMLAGQIFDAGVANEEEEISFDARPGGVHVKGALSSGRNRCRSWITRSVGSDLRGHMVVGRDAQDRRDAQGRRDAGFPLRHAIDDGVDVHAGAD